MFSIVLFSSIISNEHMTFYAADFWIKSILVHFISSWGKLFRIPNWAKSSMRRWPGSGIKKYTSHPSAPFWLLIWRVFTTSDSLSGNTGTPSFTQSLREQSQETWGGRQRDSGGCSLSDTVAFGTMSQKCIASEWDQSPVHWQQFHPNNSCKGQGKHTPPQTLSSRIQLWAGPTDNPNSRALLCNVLGEQVSTWTAWDSGDRCHSVVAESMEMNSCLLCTECHCPPSQHDQNDAHFLWSKNHTCVSPSM